MIYGQLLHTLKTVFLGKIFCVSSGWFTSWLNIVCFQHLISFWRVKLGQFAKMAASMFMAHCLSSCGPHLPVPIAFLKLFQKLWNIWQKLPFMKDLKTWEAFKSEKCFKYKYFFSSKILIFDIFQLYKFWPQNSMWKFPFLIWFKFCWNSYFFVCLQLFLRLLNLILPTLYSLSDADQKTLQFSFQEMSH